MGRDSEIFKAAQSGNNEYLERVFSIYLTTTGDRDGSSPRARGKRGGSGVSLRKSANPNMQDEQGYTLLHHATLNGQQETVGLLLCCGASTTIPDCSGSTPLHLAAWKGDLEIVKVLVSQGPSRANVNQQSDADNTALHLSAQYGYSGVVEFLLQRHADPMLHNCQGETPLDLAAQYGHLDTVHLLISHCPELLSLSRGKFSPLHLASRNGHTLVALSLINAGISVNIMGEHGTPLHEAALFGKADTVRMLLDKGAKVEAKDRASKTVLEALRDFPAEKAKEITKMIEEHQNEVDLSGVASHVVAVAKTSSQAMFPSALSFAAGDHITVTQRISMDTFHGNNRGKSGTFFASDVVFHTECGGQLMPVESLDDVMPAPPPPLPPHPVPSLNHTHDTPPDEQQVTKSPRPPESHDHHHHDNYEHLEILEESQRHLSPDPAKGNPLPSKGSPPSTEGSPLPVQGRKLSKKEKRFQLSRDDGAYCELSNIDPITAKSEFGVNLRLNPVGPAFVPPPPSHHEPQETKGDTVTAHNGPSPPIQPVTQEQKPEFLGSYYVLEVGNFDEDNLSNQLDKSSNQFDKTQPAITRTEAEDGVIPAGYYMLDMDCMDPEATDTSSETKRKSHRSSCSSGTSYENIATPPVGKGGIYENVGPKKPVKYENIVVKRCHERQKSSPLGIPQSTTGGMEGPRMGGHNETTMVRRMSTSLPSETTTGEIAREQLTAAVAPGEREVKGHLLLGEPLSSDDVPRRPRSRRDMIYEVMPLPKNRAKSSSQRATESGRGNVKSNGGPRVEKTEVATSDGPTTHGLENGHQQTGERGEGERGEGERREAKVEEEEQEEERENGESEGREIATAAESQRSEEEREKGEEGTEEVGEEEREEEEKDVVKGEEEMENEEEASGRAERELLTKLMESNGLPFAGLVMSSSATEGDIERPNVRPRTDTIWDDDRVRNEWSQIDSLLEDMSGSIDSSSLTLSPLHKQLVPNLNPTPASISAWLATGSMEKYGSNLETNGFDCISFLGRGMLSGDDLIDIGIASQEDRLTLQATSYLLPPPPSVREVTSVTEWLEELQLSQLANKFQGFTLPKISRMWDIELTSVVGVELLGHRRRLLYGISELCSAHPEWSISSVTTKHRTPQNPPPSTQEPVTLSLFRDYTGIQPSPQQQTSRSSTSPIELRPPLEAQSVNATRPHSMLSRTSSWQHNVSALVDKTVNYKAKYLGSVIVVRVRGTQSTEEACLRLRTLTENMQKLPDIVLSISWKGVKFIDAKTKMVVSTHLIQDISYCSQDIEDKCVFAYITKDKSGMYYSHVFMATSVAIADEIVMTIGQAFEIAYQKVQKVRNKSTPPRYPN